MTDSTSHIAGVKVDRPSRLRLFLAFLRLGLTAFGGPAMVAYIRDLAVKEKHWLSQECFEDGAALCQSIPGATAMQTAAYVGLRSGGPLGHLINLRNDKQHYQDGLFMLDIPTFNEGAVREAILNAVAHRDYRHPGSIFIRQFPRRIEIVSPGGFPQGITPENILDRQQLRNRRVAETLARCGFVERAGQGANRIFETCIRESKPLPDFINKDAWQVSLTLRGEVGDPQFVKFLERIGLETGAHFDTHDFLLLDLVHREKTVPEALLGSLNRLAELGAVERIGRGRGFRYLLSRRFYSSIGRRGEYTRRKELDRETNKALLLKHITENCSLGSKMKDLLQVLPAKSRSQIQVLIRELAEDGKVHIHGHTIAGRWYPGFKSTDCYH
jgi:ATP-dependent DNA helicase RecG